MNAETKSAPGRCSNTAEGLDLNAHHYEGVSVMSSISECRHCTVPTTEGDVCAFCSSYTAPVDDALADAVSHTAAAIAAAAETLEHLPADAPLFGAVDVVNALAHLRKAASRLDRVGRALAVQQVAGGAR